MIAWTRSRFLERSHPPALHVRARPDNDGLVRVLEPSLTGLRAGPPVEINHSAAERRGVMKHPDWFNPILRNQGIAENSLVRDQEVGGSNPLAPTIISIT